MSHFFWKLKSIIYQFRKIPGISRIINSENRAIKTLLSLMNIEAIESVVDLGSGRGNCLSFCNKNIHRVIAIDSCFPMLKRTRPYFSDVMFINSDVMDLPVKPGSIDLVFCVGLSEYIENFEVLLGNIKNIVSPSGYIILTTSPKNIFSYLRYLLGNNLYVRNNALIIKGLKKNNLEIINKTKTLMQTQYLLKNVQPR